MKVWRNSKMSTLFYSADEAWGNHPCIVQIDDENIFVKYMENGTPVEYKGRNFSDGHFELRSTHMNGHATLHRHPARKDTHQGDSQILEGSWVENGYRGMWRVQLFESSEDETGELYLKDWDDLA